MRRGDLVTVALTGDYGKPRPAVIVQTDALSDTHASVIVCPLTSATTDIPEFRISIEPNPNNGLRVRSQIMADKPVTVRRDRIGQKIGQLKIDELSGLNKSLAFVMGLAG